MTDPLDGSVRLEPDYAEDYADLFGPSCERTEPTNPRFVYDDPTCDCPIDSFTEEMGAVADEVREIRVEFGQRPYRVFSVVYEWSGGEEGRGELSIVSEREFRPRPHVDLRPTRHEMTAAGEKMVGSARLTEVSPRMTEEQIFAFTQMPLKRGQFSFIEVRMDERDGTQVVRRRYIVRDIPYRNAKKFWWEVPLQAQELPRTTSGELEAPSLYPPRLRPA